MIVSRAAAAATAAMTPRTAIANIALVWLPRSSVALAGLVSTSAFRRVSTGAPAASCLESSSWTNRSTIRSKPSSADEASDASTDMSRIAPLPPGFGVTVNSFTASSAMTSCSKALLSSTSIIAVAATPSPLAPKRDQGLMPISSPVSVFSTVLGERISAVPRASKSGEMLDGTNATASTVRTSIPRTTSQNRFTAAKSLRKSIRLLPPSWRGRASRCPGVSPPGRRDS